MIVLWDGTPHHRAKAVREAAGAPDIALVAARLQPRPDAGRGAVAGLREDVTYHCCHAGLADLSRCVAAFEARLNRNPGAIADRLRVEDHLDPEQEKLRFPKQTRFRSRFALAWATAADTG